MKVAAQRVDGQMDHENESRRIASYFKPGTACLPPSHGLLERFQTNHRVAFPQAFIALLRVANGAVPLRNRIDAPPRERLIERFLCLVDDYKGPDGTYDIGVVLTQVDARICDERYEDDVSGYVIPFAVLFGGDFLCLDFRDKPKTPSVCVWLHEESTDFNPAFEQVAPTFDAFLDALHT